MVLKDRIRIKQFFIDFDRLRKGTVGEAAVSIPYVINILQFSPRYLKLLIVQNMHGNVKFQVCRRRNPVTDLKV
jgi:hypothetical protein